MGDITIKKSNNELKIYIKCILIPKMQLIRDKIRRNRLLLESYKHYE